MYPPVNICGCLGASKTEPFKSNKEPELIDSGDLFYWPFLKSLPSSDGTRGSTVSDYIGSGWLQQLASTL